jgi:hypothetical protein
MLFSASAAPLFEFPRKVRRNGGHGMNGADPKELRKAG